MKVSKFETPVQSLSKSKVSFKSVHYVKPSQTEIKELNLTLDFPDYKATEELYKILNPTYNKALVGYNNKDLLLIRHGELINCITVNKPALILVNDKKVNARTGFDAKAYIRLGKKYDKAKIDLCNKSIKTLEKMLTPEEIDAAKNPSIEEIKNPWNSYKDRLLRPLREKLLDKLKFEEQELYEKFLKKATVWAPEDIQAFQGKVLESFKSFTKKI